MRRARQNGWLSANDIRELEDMDRIPTEEGGDLYLVNGSMTPLKHAGAAYGTGKEGNESEEVLELDEGTPERTLTLSRASSLRSHGLMMK